MFGTDCRSPTEAALLPSSPIRPVEVFDLQLVSLQPRAYAVPSVSTRSIMMRGPNLGSSFWVIGCWLGFSGKKVGDKGNSPNDPDVCQLNPKESIF